MAATGEGFELLYNEHDDGTVTYTLTHYGVLVSSGLGVAPSVMGEDVEMIVNLMEGRNERPRTV